MCRIFKKKIKKYYFDACPSESTLKNNRSYTPKHHLIKSPFGNTVQTAFPKNLNFFVKIFFFLCFRLF